MSSLPWKKHCLTVSVLCWIVGLIVMIISWQLKFDASTYSLEGADYLKRTDSLNKMFSRGLYGVICSPLFAYLYILLNKHKSFTIPNRRIEQTP